MATAIIPGHCNNMEMALDVREWRKDNGAPLQIWELTRRDCEFQENQEFAFKFHSDGTFSIFPRHALATNRCLTSIPTAIELWEYEGKHSQKWSLETLASGIAVESLDGSGYLEVERGRQENGAPIKTYPPGTATAGACAVRADGSRTTFSFSHAWLAALPLPGQPHNLVCSPRVGRTAFSGIRLVAPTVSNEAVTGAGERLRERWNDRASGVAAKAGPDKNPTKQ